MKQPHGTAVLLEDAIALSSSLQHSTHDCIYLALAQRVQATLITADQWFWARRRSLGLAGLERPVRLLVQPLSL